MVASAGSRAGRVPVLAKYDVLEELGHGGMATVYRAHDRRLARDVAVKVLHPHLRESREIAHRFAVEAKAVAKLRHPNIVEVFDVSSDEDDEQYLVVELVRGPTLRRLLTDRGVFPPEIAASFVLELLAGIAHAHASGVIHRDVKPENVLVEHQPSAAGAPVSSLPVSVTPVPSSQPNSGDRRTPPLGRKAGDRVSVKLTDFGIAKLLDAQGVTSTGQVLGSPAHMAPEQIEGGDVDGRADVFGLGVLMYECMVGHLPFLGNNPAQVLRRVLDGTYSPAERERPTVGKTWSQIMDRALARKAEARFSDAAAMHAALTTELDRLGMGAPRVEIEAWLDDPDAWTAAHDKRLIDRLCQLGAASRKQGDAVSAASDYNRALAYAPNDPSLLRIVASMHRSEARARLARRVAPLVLGAGVLSSGAYFVAKSFKADPARRPDAPVVTAETRSVASQLPSAEPPVSTTPTAVTSGAPKAPPSAATRVVATPTVAGSTSHPGVERTFHFTSLRPPFGVHMTIDGSPAPDPAINGSFALDDKAHDLGFTCTGDACEPKTIKIPAGTKSEGLPVELAIPPAKLVVDGESGHSYGVEELPNQTISPGQETDIPMMAGTRQVTVFDRIDPTKKQTLILHAGKHEKVTLKSP
jgi:serine/threonine-protein kinase